MKSTCRNFRMSHNNFMEVTMAMLNWNDYRSEILARVGEIGKLSPDTVRAIRRSAAPEPRPGILTARPAR